MSHFDARIRLPGQTRLPVSITVDVSDDRIKFIKDGRQLGDWSLDEIEVDVRPDAIYLEVDQEEIVLSVADADRFAGALMARRPPAATSPPPGDSGPGGPTAPVTDGHTGNGLAGRLRRIDPEARFEEIRNRIVELAGDMADESVSPRDVFGRWLRLLKELNVRHGQGAIPAPIFHRLNTELLDLMPVPTREPKPELQEVGPGPRI